MKKILFIIIALFMAIITMAYLYFSGFSAETKNSQHSLYVAAANSSMIFSFENDKSIVDILKSQDLLKDVLGASKIKELQAINDYILALPGIAKFFQSESVYVAIHPGLNNTIDFLYSTQISLDFTTEQLLQTLKSGNLEMTSVKNTFSIKLTDSSLLYIGIKENLLLLSAQKPLVEKGLAITINQSSRFTEFIQANSRIAKNSLAEVYINFETLPGLLKATMPGKLTAELAPLNDQKTYAALVYNYSKEKLLLTGTTVPQTANNYYSIFTNESAQKIAITNILPANTATYTAFAVNDYSSFRTHLQKWFKDVKSAAKVEKTILDINAKYRINLENSLQKQFKNEFITFQLSTSERLGAVSLHNGDKLDQLLLELSDEYTEDIKQLKVDGLLYSFFGTPFQHFEKPYYTILDNYMVFTNNAATLNSFINSYRSNKLLINDTNYNNAMDQLPVNSNIYCYLDLNNASKIAQKNIYLPFFRHIYSEEGLKNYGAISFQLSSDNHKFLTNLLLSKKQTSLPIDSLASTN